MKSVLYRRGSRNEFVRAREDPVTSNECSEPRFVADKMLGRLARWLRLLGYDVLYGSNWSGRGLLRVARDEGRIVLTRDRRLVRDPNMPPHLFVEDDLFRDQLRQVVEAFGLDPWKGLFTRCGRCNTRIVDVDSAAIDPSEVPEFVYRTQTRYRRCPRCRHLYWEATHVTRVRTELEGMGLVPRGAET